MKARMRRYRLARALEELRELVEIKPRQEVKK